MENAHLRFGLLEYVRMTEETSTRIRLRVDRYMGEDRQAHLLSVFGNDSDVGAITAAVHEKATFSLTFPDSSAKDVSLGEHASCYKGAMAFAKHQRTEKAAPIFEAMAASAEPDLPAYSGLFELSEGRDLIPPDEFESRHGLRLWLVLLIEHFLGALGYVLNGEVSWTADDLDDHGSIFVKDNAVECVDDFIVNQGPSWFPEHYSDDGLKTMIQELIDSADSTGCSPDLTVVASKAVDSLREALSRL